MMLRGALIVGLLVISICGSRHAGRDGSKQRGQSKERQMWIKFLHEEGLTDEEIVEWMEHIHAKHSHGEEETLEVSWADALGYEECEEFKRGKHVHHHGDHHEEDQDHGDHDGHADHSDHTDHVDHDGHKNGRHTKPKPIKDICGVESECPRYENVTSHCGFGARKIFGGKWVETDINVDNIDEWIMKGFIKLLRYINGHNERQVKLDMTAPVISKWFMDAEYKVTKAGMYFYIPEAHQDNPPAPVDPLVRVVEWSDCTVFYRAFGGRQTDNSMYEAQFTKLYMALAKAGVEAISSVAITAGFTEPSRGLQRYEVMAVKG